MKKDLQAVEQKRPEVRHARHVWITRRQRFMANLLPRIGFIDETSLKTNMAKTTGWSAKGARLTDHTPFGHWNTQTFIAALRHDRLDAPWVIDGAPLMHVNMHCRAVDEQGPLRALYRDPARPDPAPRRCNHSGQSIITQKPQGRRCHARGRRLVSVPLFGENAPLGPFLIPPTPTAPILIPSKWHSPNSRPSSGERLRGPMTISGAPSVTSVNSSRMRNATTSSRLLDMKPIERNTL